jgi:asparagine synthase (glutamine-hydrolysing)
MCGIAGFIDLRRDGRIDQDVLRRMTDVIVHRGPDRGGFFVEESVALGFRRLSIIDLHTGDQPLFNEDRSLVLTCNGEIYNYRELRDELTAKGHVFQSQTDVEVLLHLYEEEGPDLLKRLNGQFAFALYDRRERSLLLARDQFGICPLYYSVVDGLLIYASEIKAILEHPRAPREVDLTGLDQVLTFPGPVSPRTVFRDIESLPSGHFMLARNGEVKTAEYWDLDYPLLGEEGDGLPEEYYAGRLEELFEQSVRYRLQADVPVGFFLSGGLDSSMIAAMIRRVSPEIQRHSFSVSFTDERISEAKYQRLMSRFVSSIHHDIPFGETDVALRLGEVVYHAECPLKETYDTASLALSRATREQGIVVVLNGEGSDELFAGYVGYRFDKRRAKEARKHDLDTVLGDEIRERLWGDRDLYYERDEHAFRAVKEMLYVPDLAERLDEFDCTNFQVVNKEKLRGRHPVHKRSYLDFKLRLAGHLIADHGDRMAMASSIEARYPFLDLDLVEFCRQIPPDLKLKGFTEKAILKKMAGDLIPREIVEREKFAFVAPGTPSLLQQEIEWIQDQLSYERIQRQGYFNPDTVEFLKNKQSQKGYTLSHNLEDDLLIVVLTFGLLQDAFNLPVLS